MTAIDNAGSSLVLHRSASLKERAALALRVSALKKLGHAISSDEVIENNEASGDVRVWHYLECVACKRTVL